MTPAVAETKLIESRRTRKKATGPPSLGFTITQIQAVRALAANCHSQRSIATLAGLTHKQFRAAMEADPELRDAWDVGIADERSSIESALLKTALATGNPRQVQAGGAAIAKPSRTHRRPLSGSINASERQHRSDTTGAGRALIRRPIEACRKDARAYHRRA